MFNISKLNRNIVRLQPLLRSFHNNYLFSSFDTKKDYYKILGVDKGATDGQIKSAFYKLAKQYHPDHNKGQQSKFKQINQAYSVLSDEKIKKQYQESRNSTSQSYSNSQGYYGNNSYGNSGFGSYGNGYGDSYGGSYGNDYNQNYGNYSDYGNQGGANNQWRRTRQRNQERDFQQNGYYEYNPFQKNYEYYSSRNNYQNPYEAYNKFKRNYSQANADTRQRIRKAQQQRYEEWLKYQQKQQQQIAKGFSRAAKFTLTMTVFIVLLTFARYRNQQQYQQYQQYQQSQYYMPIGQPVSPYRPYRQQQYYQNME